MSKKTSIPFITTILFFAALIALYFLHPGFHDNVKEGFEVLSNKKKGDEELWIQSFGNWGVVILILGFLLQMFLFVIPSILLMSLCILLYGPLKGSLVLMAGTLLASTVGFVMGKFLGKRTLHQFIEKDTEEKISFYVKRYGMLAVIISRFSPFLSLDALSFVAGILHMNFWRFILATIIGIVPLNLAIIYFDQNEEGLKNGLIWLSAISLLGFIFFIFFDRRKRKHKS